MNSRGSLPYASMTSLKLRAPVQAHVLLCLDDSYQNCTSSPTISRAFAHGQHLLCPFSQMATLWFRGGNLPYSTLQATCPSANGLFATHSSVSRLPCVLISTCAPLATAFSGSCARSCGSGRWNALQMLAVKLPAVGCSGIPDLSSSLSTLFACACPL